METPPTLKLQGTILRAKREVQALSDPRSAEILDRLNDALNVLDEITKEQGDKIIIED